MTNTHQCPRCGTELSSVARLRDLCPRCLLLLGLGAEPEENVTIGKFEILAEVGRGGMGVVYKAWQASLNRVVALKVLSGPLARDESFVRRFHNEATAAAQLNHPNVVAIYEVGSDGDQHYIAMEYIDGLSLAERIEDRGPLECEEALGIAQQVLGALKAAHDLGIVHRDIKPHNLIIDPAGRVRVLDFGLARLPADMAASQTDAGGVLGTLPYMAPEQCSRGGVDHRADLYSTGAVLYQMLTGRLPFRGDSPATLIRAIVDDPSPDPRRYNPGVPDDVARVTARALAKDPGERYSSAAEMEQAIRRCLAPGSPSGKGNPAQAAVAAGDEPKNRKTSRPARTRKIATLALAVVLVGTGGFLAIRLWPSGHEGRETASLAQVKLIPADAAVYDVLGHCVAVDGETVLLGALRDDDHGPDSGSAVVFERKRGRWTKTAKLTPSDATAGQWFGYSVALDGDRAVVGAYKNSEQGRWSGAAYVFERGRRGWREVAKLTARDAAADDWFGFSVALQDQTVVVGAIHGDAPGNRAGAVYVFQNDGAVWREAAKFTPEKGESEDLFGYSVAIDGDTIALGAVGQRPGPGRPRSGCAYVYLDSSPAGDWSLYDTLKVCARNATAGDWFGSDVAIQQDLLVVGARSDDDHGAESGAAFVFRQDGSDWTEEAQLIPEGASSKSQFGGAVALDAGRILIGAEHDSFPNEDCGAVYVFEQRDGRWEEVGRLTAADCDVGDWFGADVGIDGETVLVGAECDDECGKDSGAAYVFDLQRKKEGATPFSADDE